MPVWSPGYYGVGDYSRNVSNFRVEDGAGHALPWEKVTTNTWRVAAANAPAIVVSYDVFGAVSFAANTYIGDDRAYLSPSSVFVHVAGMIQHPVTVTFQLPANWKQIATGLEPIPGKVNTYSAPDFDVLYDSPILIGNQEYLSFDVKGVPHFVAIENVSPSIDRTKMLADLKRMVTAATELIGDVPYKHYTFLMMGRGNGGIEHLNSASIQFNGDSLGTDQGYLRWLSYVCHQYFHNFNVKRIRPIALGPFDYDQPNLTNILWVSEGLSVYYQDLVLVRSGQMTSNQYLDKMKNLMASFENSSGRHYQSDTESSINTWNTGSGVGGDRNTTISYYNNGAMMGAMLDLKIRNESKNRKSLDDVMRGLYRKYYLEKKRGFTDAEFRAECEAAAGADMAEVFEYASTSKDANYAKYFAYAGLRLDVKTEDAPGAFLGVNTHAEEPPPAAPSPGGPGRGGAGRGGRGGAPELRLVITGVSTGSPAQTAGLEAQDQIVEVDGAPASAKVLNDALMAKRPGDKLKLRISRSGSAREVEVELAKNEKKTFSFEPVTSSTPLQAAILKDWLRAVQ